MARSIRSLLVVSILLTSLTVAALPASAHYALNNWGGSCPIKGETEHTTGSKYHKARTTAMVVDWMINDCRRVRAIANYETYQSGSRRVESCVAVGYGEALVSPACGSAYSTRNWSTHSYEKKVSGVYKWVYVGSTHS